MKFIIQIRDIALRELQILRKNNLYAFCMVVFPLLTGLFFTSLLSDGVPLDLPIGVVDLDNSSTSRSLVRRLDAFQNSRVVAHYPSVTAARIAIQENEIYAFLYIPDGMAEKLLAGRQPKISYYYSMASLVAGSMVMKDLKTITTLGSAGVGQATMQAKGYTPEQIQTALQPVRIDTHQIGNPEGSYNVYLSTALVPGIMILFMMLISTYSLGMELKFDTGKELLAKADGNIVVAIIGKFLIHFIVFLMVVLLFQYYIYGGLMPSLRMSMSICSLWAVLSISIAGSTFPVMGMDAPIQALSWLFPLRHYFMIYEVTVFNGFSLINAWFHLVALVGFALLPWFVVAKIKNAMLTYVYIP